jgi:excinuclease UvrABC nuclease subunit
VTGQPAASGEYAVEERLDEWIETIPDRPAVFLIHPRDASAATRPYLAHTTVLRRRLRRLLGAEGASTHRLSLRAIAARVEYRFTSSRLEASLVHYEWARRYFPDDYERIARIRPAPFVKVLLGNAFPRTCVTTRLSGGSAFQYGPFRTRAAAEEFEQETLNLFQVRRCQEDLAPSEDHPGCVYGEMGRCLRPCQRVVGEAEYASEVARLVEFLATGGASLLHTLAAQRDRCSEELRFEEARRMHERYARVEQTLKLRDELATRADRLGGVAVLRASVPGTIALRFLLGGVWLGEQLFATQAQGGTMVPLDRRLRELVATLSAPRVPLRERQEHIALLARWFYSTWRDGEWIGFASLDEIPYRRLVRAISTVAAASAVG